MSHVTTVSLEVKDLDALQVACEKLGLELVRDVKTYKQYMKGTALDTEETAKLGLNARELATCEHVIRVVGATERTYEIGVKMVDGSYRLLFDTFNGGYGLMEKVASEGGRNINKLTLEYSIEAGRRSLKRQGYRVTERIVNGRRQLVATV